MDYCSSCRRHLNGALVCPGCGAYAPDIAPPGTDGSAGTTPMTAPMTSLTPMTPVAATQTPAAAEPYPGPDTWYDDTHLPDALDTPDTPAPTGTAAAVDVTDAPRAPQGRAARRRQLARWKKSQRRAVVATAVALVGGGVTLASLDRGSGDRAQAATAPDNRSMGVGEKPASATPPSGTPTASGRHRQPTSTPHTPTARTAPVGYVVSPAGVPQQRAQSSAPRHAAPASRTDTASTPITDPTSTPIPSPSSGTGTGTGTTANPAPTTGTGTGTSTSGSSTSGQTGSSTSGSSSSTSSSSSSGKLCLVVVCLG
ncbi:hypothetical protein [Streptomyces sp. CoH27]|uniref:SCO2400 family protein n=1 Tax=Streptomyces sp. CoH27 TaxID=2875763 RepID=UPI001CD383B7|nr:hypothetical protein [Streptomyces sp. CoH27]